MRDVRRYRPIHLFFIVLSVLGAADLRAQGGEPRAVVSAFQDELLATMKEAKFLGFEGRYHRLMPDMELAFDFEQITRIAVGPNWVKMNKMEQEQVVDLFRQFSVSTYAGAFSSYDGEKFEIGAARTQAGIGTIVETRLVLKD